MESSPDRAAFFVRVLTAGCQTASGAIIRSRIGRGSAVKTSNTGLVEVQGDWVVVTEPTTQCYAIYTTPTTTPRRRLILKRRSDTEDYQLLARAWQAANDKARELGWIA